MKVLKVDGVVFKSKCDYVREMLKDSPNTLLTDSDIARIARVKPQTVYRQKEILLGLR